MWFALLLSGGCNSYAVPPAHLSNAQNTIADAQSAGAEADPQAGLHLGLARRQMACARSLIAQGEPASADLFVLRAQADAELALSLAQEASARAEARQMIERVRVLSASESK
jgi:hypothetical protein